jgi:hypothetical protein
VQPQGFCASMSAPSGAGSLVTVNARGAPQNFYNASQLK